MRWRTLEVAIRHSLRLLLGRAARFMVNLVTLMTAVVLGIAVAVGIPRRWRRTGVVLQQSLAGARLRPCRLAVQWLWCVKMLWRSVNVEVSRRAVQCLGWCHRRRRGWGEVRHHGSLRTSFVGTKGPAILKWSMRHAGGVV